MFTTSRFLLANRTRGRFFFLAIGTTTEGGPAGAAATT